jgi:hypothetical protein
MKITNQMIADLDLKHSPKNEFETDNAFFAFCRELIAMAQEVEPLVMQNLEENMGSMKGKQAKIDAALGRLADMISGGHLMASADPVGFLDTIATELRELRDENVKLRGLMSVEADKHNERQILLQNTMEQLEELKSANPAKCGQST